MSAGQTRPSPRPEVSDKGGTPLRPLPEPATDPGPPPVDDHGGTALPPAPHVDDGEASMPAVSDVGGTKLPREPAGDANS